MKGSISISRMTGGGDEVIRIEIEDDSSNVAFFTGELNLADFAHAVTGRSNVPIEYTTRGLNLLGSKSENKREIVPFEPYDHYDERRNRKCDDADARTASVAKALKRFEVDGWKANVSDMWNSHCTKPGGQSVAFFRHVDASGVPIK